MWIFTETGFVSVVRKPDAPIKVTVRARDRRSLLELSELAETEIVETPYADYRFRVLVDDIIFKTWFTTAVDMLDYDVYEERLAPALARHPGHHRRRFARGVESGDNESVRWLHVPSWWSMVKMARPGGVIHRAEFWV